MDVADTDGGRGDTCPPAPAEAIAYRQARPGVKGARRGPEEATVGKAVEIPRLP